MSCKRDANQRQTLGLVFTKSTVFVTETILRSYRKLWLSVEHVTAARWLNREAQDTIPWGTNFLHRVKRGQEKAKKKYHPTPAPTEITQMAPIKPRSNIRQKFQKCKKVAAAIHTTWSLKVSFAKLTQVCINGREGQPTHLLSLPAGCSKLSKKLKGRKVGFQKRQKFAVILTKKKKQMFCLPAQEFSVFAVKGKVYCA